MHTFAFYDGIGDTLRKQGISDSSGAELTHEKKAFGFLPQMLAKGVTDLVQGINKHVERAAAPAVAGWSDKNNGGGVQYDPVTHTAIPDMGNIKKMIFNGVPNGPAQRQPYDSFVDRMAYRFGQSDTGKKFIENSAGGADNINKRISSESHGIFTSGSDGKFQMDRGQIPSYMLSKARTWLDTNPGKATAILGGLGIGALGIGSIMGGKKENPTDLPPAQGAVTQAGPGSLKAAPYGGRDGYMFAQANKV